MRRPLSSRMALMLGAGAVLYAATTAAALAQAASTPDVHVDLRALDQLGYTAAKAPPARDRMKLKAPTGIATAAPSTPTPSNPAPSRPAAAAPPPAAEKPAPAVAERRPTPAPPPRAAAAPVPPVAAVPPPAPSSTPTPPAAPAPAPAVAPPPTVATPQTAALAAPPAAQKRGEARVAFPAGSTDLPPNARGDLDQMARRLAGDEALRVQLNAYAAENGDQASQARRISLSRALAVRAYLIDKGVRSTRLDVRALGKPQDNGPADRVDLVVVGR